MRISALRLQRLVAVAAISIATACGRGEITLPEADATGQFTADASSAWTYASLSGGAIVPQTSAATSDSWDIGFNGTNVVLNGGANGPGGVTAYCICQNATATNTQVLAMTPDNQVDAFTSVTIASIPPATAGWSSDVFATSKWYKYNLAGDNRISPTFQVYLLQRGTTVYKIQLISYYGPAGETRRITVRHARLRI